MVIDGLSLEIDETTILDGLSVDIPDARISVLIGPNGAGKTTLLRCLWGELSARAGAIRLHDRLVDPASDEWKRCIGAVPDSDAVFEELSVEEQLELAAALFGLSKEQRERRVHSLIALADLSERRHALGHELSAGMRKRLAIAISLVHAPRILLFDEPLNAMDFASAETFFELLRVLRSLGRTVLLTGHTLPALVRVADRVVELDRGRLVGCHDLTSELRSMERLGPLLATAARRPTESVEAALSWMEA